jgi:hypothetical protein
MARSPDAPQTQNGLSSTERAALSGAFASGYESVFGVMAETRTTRAPAQNASAKSIDPDKD